MKLSEFLQGKWLGHPLHSAIVHVPVGSWIAACLLDLSHQADWLGREAGVLALVCVGVGLLGALLAVAPGIADWSQIKKEKPAWKLGLYHMLLNIVAVIVWGINFAQRLNTETFFSSAILLTSVIGAALVFVSGYLGSLMVFDQGTAVARESKKEWRQIAQRGGSRVPEEK